MADQRTSSELPVCCLCYETLGRYGGPVTLPCGHNGCRECLSSLSLLSANPACPLCRSPFSASQPLICNHELRDLVTLASSMFVTDSDCDGWQACPPPPVVCNHALRELRQGQLDSAAIGGPAAANGGCGGGGMTTKEGVELSGPSAPPDMDGWADGSGGGGDPAADEAVHRGLLELERPRWLPDSYATSCGGCQQAFRPLARLRHHCRMCGRIFCHACCHKKLLLPPKYDSRDPQRVCEPCATMLAPLQPFLAGLLSHAMQAPVHDAVDAIALRSWVNLPWSAALGQDIFKATNILQTFSSMGRLQPERGVPAAVLRGARGLVLLSVLRIGAARSWAFGTGLVVARNSADGGWSAPCAVSFSGVGLGLQVGGELVDLLLVLRTDAAVQALCGSGVHIGVGGSVGAAVGLAGRHTDAMVLGSSDGTRATVCSYSVSRGAYVGASLELRSLRTRDTVNRDFYGYPVTSRQLLLDGAVAPPPAASMLYDALGGLQAKLAAAAAAPPPSVLPSWAMGRRAASAPAVAAAAAAVSTKGELAAAPSSAKGGGSRKASAGSCGKEGGNGAASPLSNNMVAGAMVADRAIAPRAGAVFQSDDF